MAEGVRNRLSGVRALSYVAVAAVVAVTVIVGVGKLAGTPMGWFIAGLAGGVMLFGGDACRGESMVVGFAAAE